MGKKIGNVSTLNIVNATKESIGEIEHIENVALILYSKETAPLLSLLNTGNIGQTLEIEHDIHTVSGSFTLDAEYLNAFEKPTTIIANGVVIVDPNVTVEHLTNTHCQFLINGAIFTTTKLKGSIGLILKNTNGTIRTYDHQLPRFETGKVKLTNGYLEGLNDHTTLLISGKLLLDAELDIDLFSRKIADITLTGKAVLFENQEKAFHEKSTIIGKTDIIPNGYQEITKTLHLNERSIKRFKGGSIFTTKPILFTESISRNAFDAAFASIHSTSYIVCHEDLEDLVYECLHQFETEVVTYTDAFRFIDNEEWQQEDADVLDSNTTLIVQSNLTFSETLQPEKLYENIQAIHLFGTIYTANSTQRAAVQKLLHTKNGEVIDVSKQKNKGLGNIGELTL